VAAAEQPNHSLPAEKLPTTSTTTTTRSTTTSTAAVYRNVLEVDTPSRPRPSLVDRHPPTVSFDFATRQRPRQLTSTPPPRRRWPPRRGRYPPTRHRYGRRPSYRSASGCQQVSTFLLAVLAVLVAMDVWAKNWCLVTYIKVPRKLRGAYCKSWPLLLKERSSILFTYTHELNLLTQSATG